MLREGSAGSEFLLGDILRSNLCWEPDRLALIDRRRSLTWAEFGAEVERLRNGLVAMGVCRGTRVAVLDRNRGETVLLHYALASLGAVLAPINMWLRAAEVHYILGVSQPFLLVTSAEFLALSQAACDGLAVPPRLVVHDAPESGLTPWEALLVDRAPARMPAPESWEDPHLILHTSGTTGRPKGAVLSHKRSVLDALNALPAFGIRRFERFYCYMPLFHTGAWDYLKLYFMQQGAAYIADRFEPVEAIHAIREHRLNGMFGVPRVLRQMIENAAWAEADMSSMRLIAYANYDPSNLILKVHAAFRERGARELGIANAYGLTEGGPYITILRPEDALARPQSIGVPVPGVQVMLLDDAMRPVPRGETGEICIRSPAVMTGYLNRPEATAEALVDGWLKTGDLGRIDAEGFLHLVDRKKDMIRSGGENVFAKEVENTLVEHDDVRECAVIGLPDDDYGEQVAAAVVLRSGAAPDAEALAAFVRGRIAGFKTPRRFVFVEDLPKTPAGKIKKHEIKVLFE
ncbi:acyl-CoA synthetase [Paralimibaculum aggregatum]|uniref:Acyl-CoA synthetase n=1 Tax=Paralimibaculum aggregatum TaxID=3036245 RepID=A0ABQ6LTH1_9RHOB|nr:acyl-CoA synthetase [Limibaculum sp. NKW23]